MKKRVCSLLLVLAMLLAVIPEVMFAADAAKQEKTRAIGIVFDNSGSMYNNQAWCHATYAMEVFAAMMNDGDQLQVYPMWPIQIGEGGKEYTQDNPLVINGPGEASTLRKIITPQAGTTPIETITAAYNGLKRSSADEKYLIVLTDGSSFYNPPAMNDADALSVTNTQKALTELLGQYSAEMYTMYLGIGNIQYPPEVTNASRQIVKVARQSADTLEKLTELCNSIFGRNVLEGVSGQISFDVSMSKMIVFVQGENVSGVAVSGGQEIRSAETRYSEKGSTDSRYLYAPVDKTLQGMLVTYGEFDAGSYSLNYSGDATSVSGYYEPDVDMVIQIVDENGNVVDPNSGISSGVYYLHYGMVDRDGNPTNSPLLGQTQYQLTYTINGEDFTVTDTQAGTIQMDLHGGDVLDGNFDVTYLNDYSIHKDGEDLGWPSGGLTIGAAPMAAVKAEITGGSETYDLSQLQTQGVYNIRVYYGSEQLTGSALDGAELTVELNGGNAEYCVERTDDGFLLTLGYCSGDPAGTDCGEYELSIIANYTNRDGETGSSTAVEKEFTIADNTSAVSAQFREAQEFYQNTELDQAEPIELVLTLGGAPLTAEQFAQAVVEIETGGLNCDVQPDPSGSRYLIHLSADGVENGKYKLTAVAQIPNEIGRMTEAKDAVTIEIQPYPQWFKLVFWILVTLLILVLIWLYLNTKILPKRIGAGKCTFIVDGSVIPGSPSCIFTGGKKKRGTLEVTSPKYMANPAVKCGFRLELEAISPRRIKSSARSVKVRGVTALNPTTTSIHIGSLNMIRDPNTGRLVKSGGKADAPIEFNISNNAKASVTAEVLDVIDGNEITVSMSLPLKFF